MNTLSQLPKKIQPKLTVNKPNDRFEREADAMADHVMGYSSQAPSMTPASGLQRKCAECEEEEKMVQRKTDGNGPVATNTLNQQLSRTKGQGRPLSAHTQQAMGQAFGRDFSQVRVHTGWQAAQMSQGIHAKAFTFGSNIYFNQGAYNPHSSEGKHLLAHELTHVVQQSEGKNTDSIQRFLTCEPEEECPDREPGEITRSRTSPMVVHEITSGGVGLMISNFAVDGGEIKGDPTTNPAWVDFMDSLSVTPQQTWEILGFSDCQGGEGVNTDLRAARATSLYLAMPSAAQSRVDTFAAAPIGQCVRPNTSEEERSLNRSALIRLTSTEFGEDDFTPEPIEGDNTRPVYMCSKDLDTSPVGTHAFFRLDAPGAGNETISLQPIQVNRTSDCWQGIPAWNYPSDQTAAGTCTLTPFSFRDVYNQFQAYPIGHYCTWGPNSNTFVGQIARNLGMSNPDPSGWNPGMDESPPPAGTFAPNKWATLSGCTTIECIPDALADTDRAVV